MNDEADSAPTLREREGFGRRATDGPPGDAEERPAQLVDLVRRSTDVNELLEAFGQQVFMLPGVQGCLVNLEKVSGDALETAYIKLPGEFVHLQKAYKGFHYHLDKFDVNVQVFREGKFQVVGEADLGRYAETTRMRYERWKMLNMVIVPLAVSLKDGSQQQIGTVMVFSQETMLDAELAEKVEAIGALFSAQVQIQWNYHEVVERAKMVELMHAEIQQFIIYITEMNALTAVDAVYALIGKEFVRRFKFDMVGILLAENDELAIEHVAFSDPFEHVRERYESFQKETRYSLSMRDGASAMVYLNNQRFHFEDAMKIMDLPMSVKDKTSLHLMKTPRTLLLVPILLNKVPIGVMWLITLGQPIPLSESDIALIELLGSFISTAIRNAQAHRLVEQQNRKIELLNQDLQNKMVLLDQVARRDRLTGLNNFGNFEEELKRRTSEYARAGEGSSLALILIDIDHFKKFNDSFGHPAGNQVLQEVAVRILKSIRDMDFPARYGGEEFCVLLPQCDIEGAAQIARRICTKISEDPMIVDGNPHTVHISGGCAQFRVQESYHDFIRRTDAALYEAKRNGRNRIEIATDAMQATQQ